MLRVWTARRKSSIVVGVVLAAFILLGKCNKGYSQKINYTPKQFKLENGGVMSLTKDHLFIKTKNVTYNFKVDQLDTIYNKIYVSLKGDGYKGTMTAQNAMNGTKILLSVRFMYKPEILNWFIISRRELSKL